MIFRVDMSSPLLEDNKKKYFNSLQWSYTMNFTKENTNFCLSFHYNGANSYLFLNGTEIIKVRDSEIKANPLCLGNISKD